MVRHYIVKGRVQGVGFRWLVHREAGSRGLKGWVRNTEEGEVEVMVAGSEDKLAELRAVLERAVQEKEMDEAMAESLESFQIEGAW
jgi:acylphosphatase